MTTPSWEQLILGVKVLHSEETCDWHKDCGGLGLCQECDKPWPCPTRQITDQRQHLLADLRESTASRPD